MTNHNHQPARWRHFSLSFEQMCNFAAIADTKDAHKTLRELVIQCLAVLPDDRFENERMVGSSIDALFGLQIPVHEIQFALDLLITNGTVVRQADGGLALPLSARLDRQQRIEDSHLLERRVKEAWLQEVTVEYPTLPPDKTWKALCGYLARAFRRHGIQAAELLNPSFETYSEYNDSLSVLLDEAIKNADLDQPVLVRNAVSSFFVTVGRNADRARYIAQLADGTFSYFSLVVAPDVSAQFRGRLSPISLFLDTNFLYGILDLSASPQVAVSNDLLEAITKHALPFSLLHHDRTLRELSSSIDNYRNYLGSRNWSLDISRAAAGSRNLSGVVVRYHQRRLETGVDVDSFFRPYEHLDVILDQKSITKYVPQSDRTTERALLIGEYQEWLRQRSRTKSYNLIDHDMTLLDQVRQLRSSAQSTLDAGALLITCDFLLYRFDWETSRAAGKMASAVLPNLFWQILRPFVPADTDFDRSFAETFALPEFRIIGGDSSRVASKVLYILAGYEGLPEETAARMLSNDLLIRRLRTVQDDTQFQEYVETAIVAENAALSEENSSLNRMLLELRAESEAREKEFADERSRSEAEIAEERAKTGKEVGEAAQRAADAVALAEKEKETRIEAERKKSESEKTVADIQEQYDLLKSGIKAAAPSLCLIGIFVYTVYGTAWSWLRNHPESYALQAFVIIMLILLSCALFFKKWRKWFLGAAVLSFLPALVRVSGGLNDVHLCHHETSSACNCSELKPTIQNPQYKTHLLEKSLWGIGTLTQTLFEGSRDRFNGRTCAKEERLLRTSH